MQQAVEKWGMIEVAARGSASGNPFADCTAVAVFTGANEQVEVQGFYDGDGVYKVRFMPSFEGEYRFTFSGDCLDEVVSGTFTVAEAADGNHGPVRMINRFHFAYEDGTPFYPAGTTCYTWAQQADADREVALQNFAQMPFNKIRFSMWPHKRRMGNFVERELSLYPFEKMDGSWDFTRYSPEYFKDFEAQIAALLNLGIEADLIVMNPYEELGFSQMTREEGERYWDYVVSRFAAYRNIWWSLANEYDLMDNYTVQDFEAFASVIVSKDLYRHLRSIHHCRKSYDYSRTWITHSSIQCQDITTVPMCAEQWRRDYDKPLIFDEIGYEGNHDKFWGCLSAVEMVRRFWLTAITGGYATHGEIFLREQPEVAFMRSGVNCHGDSPKRIGFLRRILSETPGYGLRLRKFTGFGDTFLWDEPVAIPEEVRYEKDYYLIYYGAYQPSERTYHIDDEHQYVVEVIDTWNMTIEKRGTYKGQFRVKLPGKAYMAVRLVKIK